MNIEIYKPLYLNELGKRENNEDSIFPAPETASENDRLFLVCDGVGGLDKGEVASQLACKSFADFFAVNEQEFKNTEVLSDFITKAFNAVQDLFDQYFATEPNAKGMGTTLTLLTFRDSEAVVAHCGDSRVYHIRGNEILFCTADHSVVNQLLQQGIITPEEAAASSQSNRITRAMQGHSVLRTKPDVKVILDLKADDYFLLCSDGVSGAVSDQYICDILSANLSDAEKMETIHQLCEANSRDNYSAYLLRIKAVDESVQNSAASSKMGKLKQVFYNLLKKT